MAPSVPKSARISTDRLLFLYQQMVLLRRFELTVQEQYKKGRMPGFVHLCLGQEAVATGDFRTKLTTEPEA